MLPPHGSVEFNVRFTSKATGKFNGALGFEVLGLPGRESQLLVSGTCEVPTVNDDPRNVFMARVKSRAESAPPLPKRYVMNRGLYEFGPLLTWKPLAAMAPPAGVPSGFNYESVKEFAALEEGLKPAAALYAATRRTNAETFRISNNGRFDTTVRFGFEASGNPLEDPEKRDPAADVFFVEPREAFLREGDTCDVTVWAHWCAHAQAPRF